MAAKRTAKNGAQPAWKPGDYTVRRFDDIDPDDFKAFWGQTKEEMIAEMEAEREDGPRQIYYSTEAFLAALQIQMKDE